MIKICEAGYSMTFANGWEVVVSFNPLCNCSNKRKFAHMMSGLRGVEESMQRSASEGCENAEVIVIGPGTHEPAEGYPRGFQTPEQIAAILAEVAQK